MPSLRTPGSKAEYQEYLKIKPETDTCPLCERESLKDFTYWRLIENKFPYDLIAQVHHLLIPIRHTSENELITDELQELKKIKSDFINETYDFILQNTIKQLSIPEHFHLHLIAIKEQL